MTTIYPPEINKFIESCPQQWLSGTNFRPRKTFVTLEKVIVKKYSLNNSEECGRFDSSCSNVLCKCGFVSAQQPRKLGKQTLKISQIPQHGNLIPWRFKKSFRYLSKQLFCDANKCFRRLGRNQVGLVRLCLRSILFSKLQPLCVESISKDASRHKLLS